MISYTDALNQTNTHFKACIHSEFSYVHFNAPVKSLSSAIVNGGLNHQQQAWLNLKVPCAFNHNEADSFDDRFEATIAKAIEHYALPTKTQHTLANLTAASMRSTRMMKATAHLPSDASNVADIYLVLSCGLNNTKTAGEISEEHAALKLQDTRPDYQPGTINIMAYCAQALTDAALVEAHSIIAEAKATCLQQLGICSSTNSQLIATGTGTDSTTICCPVNTPNYPELAFIGKHTLAGEMLAQTVIRCLEQAIDFCLTDTCVK